MPPCRFAGSLRSDNSDGSLRENPVSGAIDHLQCRIMSTASAVQTPVRLFPYERWGSPLPELARQYRENHPCPHILLKDFLDAEVARDMAAQFPQAASDAWTQYKHANENKLCMPNRELLPATTGARTSELNSPEF